jgi:translocation and assembly module TamA
MTAAARRRAAAGSPARRAARTVLAAGGLALALGLGGCSHLPWSNAGDDDAGRTKAAGAPAVKLFALEVDAPAPLDELLRTNLDVGRFQTGPSADAITLPELDRLLAVTPAQARALLETEGYFNSQVRAERQTTSEGHPLVKVSVVPGPRVVVSDVSVQATGALGDAARAGDATAVKALAELRSFWPLKVGQPFRQAAWADAKNATLAQLRGSGYAAATWSVTDARVDAVDERATLALTVDSGPLFHFGAIDVEGIQRYDEAAVRQLATFAPGDPYRERTLLDYQARIVKSGLFEGASVVMDTDPARASAAPVHVRVTELPLQQATVGVGISANTGPRATLEHYHRRIFGERWTLRDQWQVGTEQNSVGLDFTSWPLENLYRNLVSGNYERLRSADQLRTSWNARVGRTRDDQRTESTTYVETTYARVDSPTLLTEADALSINEAMVLRRVDDVLLPTRGWTATLQGALGYGKGREVLPQQADETANAKGPFVRAYLRVTGYEPLGEWHSETRLEVGQVFVISRIAVPDTILFRAGGEDSVRGYGYRTLGPIVNGAVVSGRVLTTASAEFAHPLSARLPALWGAVFVDAGNAADRWADLRAVLGYGVGVRWRSPVGPLKIDLAWGQAVQQFRLSVGVGIVF